MFQQATDPSAVSMYLWYNKNDISRIPLHVPDYHINYTKIQIFSFFFISTLKCNSLTQFTHLLACTNACKHKHTSLDLSVLNISSFLNLRKKIIINHVLLSSGDHFVDIILLNLERHLKDGHLAEIVSRP